MTYQQRIRVDSAQREQARSEVTRYRQKHSLTNTALHFRINERYVQMVQSLGKCPAWVVQQILRKIA